MLVSLKLHLWNCVKQFPSQLAKLLHSRLHHISQSLCLCIYIQAPSVSHNYSAISDYNPGDSDENGISLTEAQEVEVIGVNQFGWWWVRATNASSGEMEEGWVPASYLRCQLTHLWLCEYYFTEWLSGYILYHHCIECFVCYNCSQIILHVMY